MKDKRASERGVERSGEIFCNSLIARLGGESENPRDSDTICHTLLDRSFSPLNPLAQFQFSSD